LGTTGFYSNADDSSGETSAKKPDHIGLFDLTPRKIRDPHLRRNLRPNHRQIKSYLLVFFSV